MDKIVHKEKTELVRAFFDSGPQKFYLRKDTIKRLDLIPLDQETLNHNIFWGFEIDFQAHGIFDIQIQNMEEEFKYELSV